MVKSRPMNREELAEMLIAASVSAGNVLAAYSDDLPVLVDALWPVLAQVWEDGFGEGEAFGKYSGPWAAPPNPYSEVDR